MNIPIILVCVIGGILGIIFTVKGIKKNPKTKEKEYTPLFYGGIAMLIIAVFTPIIIYFLQTRELNRIQRDIYMISFVNAASDHYGGMRTDAQRATDTANAANKIRQILAEHPQYASQLQIPEEFR